MFNLQYLARVWIAAILVIIVVSILLILLRRHFRLSKVKLKAGHG